MRGHPRAKESLWFYTTMDVGELLKTLRSITDACPCKANKQSDVRDRGLYSSLPIPYCRNSLLYVDFVAQKKFGGYNNVLVVTCALTQYTQVYPFNTKCTSEDVVKTLVETWFKDYGAPKEMSSDEDALFRFETRWYKRVLRALNVAVHTGIPYTHTSNPLCERGNRVQEDFPEDGENPRLCEANTLGDLDHEQPEECHNWLYPP